MRIKNISIDNFGLLNKKSIKFQNGINIVYTENKNIRISMQNFILCFLYGMDNYRKTYRNIFRRKYSPFNMDKVKGTITIDKDNLEYIIDRTFGFSKGQDTTEIKKVFGDDVEKVFNVNLDQPGKTFLNMGFEAFNRTMFVKKIDDFLISNNLNHKDIIDSDITRIKENFDRKFSFDKSINIIDSARKIIKDISIPKNLNELYVRYDNLNMEFRKVKEDVELRDNYENKLKGIKKRRDIVLDRHETYEKYRNYLRYVFLEDALIRIGFVEEEILKLENDLKNINKDLPKVSGDTIDDNFIDSLKYRVSLYKESKKEILSINKLDQNKEGEVFKRFEFLVKEIEKYSYIKEKLTFYTERVRKLNQLYSELDILKNENTKVGFLKRSNGLSRVTKNKRNRTYSILYLFIIVFSIAIALVAPVFKINSNGIILIALTSFVLLGIAYVYSILKNYKDIEGKEKTINLSKFYDVKLNISKFEQELYPHKFSSVKRDLNRFYKLENELDELSIRFKEGDLAYTTIIKNFKSEEKLLLDILKDFGFKELFIQDIENFIENSLFKIGYRKSVEKDLNLKKIELNTILDSRTKKDFEEEKKKLEAFKNFETSLDYDKVDKEYSILKEDLENIDEDIKSIEEKIKSLDYSSSKENSIFEEISNVKNTITYLESKISNMDLYEEKLSNIYNELKNSLSPEIYNRMEYIMEYLLGESSIRIRKNEFINSYGASSLKQSVPIEFLNSSMWDFMYFSLRVAIADLIYEDKGEIPFILDDIFLYYDDEKMEKALNLLVKYSRDRQVIIFSSSKRESSYLKGNAYIINV